MIFQRLGLLAAGILLALAAGEAFLRIVPFERFQRSVRYGHFRENQIGRFFEYDPLLVVRNRRGASLPEDQVTINSLGLRGPEVSVEKDPGVVRILCLGDSCTFGAARPYPEILQSILDERFGRGRFEVLNGGVIGYTSLHGLEWFRRDLEHLRADIVTLYFGWNDMWRGTDSAVREWYEEHVLHEKPARRSYLWQAVSESVLVLGKRAGLVEIPIQVPPEKYRQVLVEFARLGQKGGFVPLYITAPSGFRDHETPRWLIDKGFVAEADSAPRLRALYNQIAIDVAREHGLPLADCASAFQGAREQKLFDHPGEDPIHPNELGYRKIAETLSATLSGLPVAASTGARR